MKSSGWALIQTDWCPHKKRKSVHTKRQGMRLARERDNVISQPEVTVCKPGREASGETQPADTNMLTSIPSGR